MSERVLELIVDEVVTQKYVGDALDLFGKGCRNPTCSCFGDILESILHDVGYRVAELTQKTIREATAIIKEAKGGE